MIKVGNKRKAREEMISEIDPSDFIRDPFGVDEEYISDSSSIKRFKL